MGTEHILAAAQEASLPGVDVIESLVSLLTTHWLRDIDPPAPAPMSLVSGNIYVEWLVLSTQLSPPGSHGQCQPCVSHSHGRHV